MVSAIALHLHKRKLAWIPFAIPFSKFNKTHIFTDLLRDSTVNLRQRIRNANTIQLATLSYNMTREELIIVILRKETKVTSDKTYTEED